VALTADLYAAALRGADPAELLVALVLPERPAWMAEGACRGPPPGGLLVPRARREERAGRGRV
jgi:hypothetical protein